MHKLVPYIAVLYALHIESSAPLKKPRYLRLWYSKEGTQELTAKINLLKENLVIQYRDNNITAYS